MLFILHPAYGAVARNRYERPARQEVVRERYPYRYRYSNDFESTFGWGGPRRDGWVTHNNGGWWQN